MRGGGSARRVVWELGLAFPTADFLGGVPGGEEHVVFAVDLVHIAVVFVVEKQYAVFRDALQQGGQLRRKGEVLRASGFRYDLATKTD